MKTAIVTASYHADFERFRLLCETLDTHVTGYTKHYVLVEDRDVPLFRQLQSPQRVIIGEKDLLPSWLKVFPDPLTMGRRRIWLSFKTKPLRGWHVQQFRRIAIADLVEDDAFLYLDSDVAFLRPYDCSQLWRDDTLRLLVRPGALAADSMGEHRRWSANAAPTPPCCASSRRCRPARRNRSRRTRAPGCGGIWRQTSAATCANPSASRNWPRGPAPARPQWPAPAATRWGCRR